jgi:hypothetical protein
VEDRRQHPHGLSSTRPAFPVKVREGVLTPEYEAAYRERWREQIELGQVQYDRLTHCEPPGYPRFLLEPYTHEFINLPEQSYLINDFGPSIRRVYIGQEHTTCTARTPGTATRSASGTATARHAHRSTCCRPTSRAGRR